MDHSYCPLGHWREEAQRTTAIGFASLWTVTAPLSWRGQMHYDQAKKKADEALAAWNEHIVIARPARGAPESSRSGQHQSLEPPPRIAGRYNYGIWNFSLECCSKPTRLQQRFQWDAVVQHAAPSPRPDYPGYLFRDISGLK